jgi:hypothetical protein
MDDSLNLLHLVLLADRQVSVSPSLVPLLPPFGAPASERVLGKRDPRNPKRPRGKGLEQGKASFRQSTGSLAACPGANVALGNKPPRLSIKR